MTHQGKLIALCSALSMALAGCGSSAAAASTQASVTSSTAAAES